MPHLKEQMFICSKMTLFLGHIPLASQALLVVCLGYLVLAKLPYLFPVFRRYTELLCSSGHRAELGGCREITGADYSLTLCAASVSL